MSIQSLKVRVAPSMNAPQVESLSQGEIVEELGTVRDQRGQLWILHRTGYSMVGGTHGWKQFLVHACFVFFPFLVNYRI